MLSVLELVAGVEGSAYLLEYLDMHSCCWAITKGQKLDVKLPSLLIFTTIHHLTVIF